MCILCEAWILNDGVQSKNHGAMVVTAPTTPQDWVAPFSALPLVEAVAETAAQMGTAETQGQVERLLGSLVTMIDSDGELHKEDVRGTVNELLKTLKAAR